MSEPKRNDLWLSFFMPAFEDALVRKAVQPVAIGCEVADTALKAYEARFPPKAEPDVYTQIPHEGLNWIPNDPNADLSARLHGAFVTNQPICIEVGAERYERVFIERFEGDQSRISLGLHTAVWAKGCK